MARVLLLVVLVGCTRSPELLPASGDDATSAETAAVDSALDSDARAYPISDSTPVCDGLVPTDGAEVAIESYWGRCSPVCVDGQFCLSASPGRLAPIDVTLGDNGHVSIDARPACKGCYAMPSCDAADPCSCLDAALRTELCDGTGSQCRVIDGRVHLRCLTPPWE